MSPKTTGRRIHLPKLNAKADNMKAMSRRPVRQVRQRRLLDYLQRLLKKLGLPGHLHTFRHSFVSMHLTRGTDAATVRKLMGHIDPKTLDHYTHIVSRDLRSAMKRLDVTI